MPEPLDLDGIRARTRLGTINSSVIDRQELLTEVDRLRAALTVIGAYHDSMGILGQLGRAARRALEATP